LFFPGDPQWTSGKYFNGPVWAKFFPRVGLPGTLKARAARPSALVSGCMGTGR